MTIIVHEMCQKVWYQTNERMHFVLSAVPSLWNFSIPVETLFKNE